MTIKTPVAAKMEKVSGFWYVVDATGKQIVARCNDEITADEVVSALNGFAEAREALQPFAEMARHFSSERFADDHAVAARTTNLVTGALFVRDLRRAARWLAKHP